ncbi:MAG: hypothetical protein H7840_04380 [Alphaproteobacteria bacterium]
MKRLLFALSVLLLPGAAVAGMPDADNAGAGAAPALVGEVPPPPPGEYYSTTLTQRPAQPPFASHRQGHRGRVDRHWGPPDQAGRGASGRSAASPVVREMGPGSGPRSDRWGGERLAGRPGNWGRPSWGDNGYGEPWGGPGYGPWGGPDYGPWGGPDYGPWGGPGYGPWGGPGYGPWGGPDYGPRGGPGYGPWGYGGYPPVYGPAVGP